MNAQHESLPLPGIAEVEAAAARLAGIVRRTPLLAGTPLDEAIGGRLLLKAECLQGTGSFKLRGAYNRLVQLDDERRRAGVVAFSSGNHAQGVAAAARTLGIRATIVMPSDAPGVKVAATRGYGAEVRFYDRLTEDRAALAAMIAGERGAVVVPAFDDPHIIAGQGTVGLEMIAQAGALGTSLDALLAPVSGGGLLGGIALAVKARSSATELWGVEPAGFEDLRLSLEAGERVAITPTGRSLCDALESPSPGVLTFPLLKAHLAGALAVTDREVADAMRYAFEVLKLVVEPGGCVGLAALLAGKLPTAGRTFGVVLSGGNVDPELFAKVLRNEV